MTMILVMAAIVSFSISQLFVSIYYESIQAIYVCFLYEKEAGRESNCPEGLKEFLQLAKLEGEFI